MRVEDIVLKGQVNLVRMQVGLIIFADVVFEFIGVGVYGG